MTKPTDKETISGFENKNECLYMTVELKFGESVKAVISQSDPMFNVCREAIRQRHLRVHSVQSLERKPHGVPELADVLGLNAPREEKRHAAAAKAESQQANSTMKYTRAPMDEVARQDQARRAAEAEAEKQRQAQSYRQSENVQPHPSAEAAQPKINYGRERAASEAAARPKAETSSGARVDKPAAREAAQSPSEKPKPKAAIPVPSALMPKLRVGVSDERLSSTTPLRMLLGFFFNKEIFIGQYNLLVSINKKASVWVLIGIAVLASLLQGFLEAVIPSSLFYLDFSPALVPLPLPIAGAKGILENIMVNFGLALLTLLAYATLIMLLVLFIRIKLSVLQIFAILSVSRFICVTLWAPAMFALDFRLFFELILFAFLFGAFVVYRMSAVLVAVEYQEAKTATFLMTFIVWTFSTFLLINSPTVEAVATMGMKSTAVKTYMQMIGAMGSVLQSKEGMDKLQEYMKRMKNGESLEEIVLKDFGLEEGGEKLELAEGEEGDGNKPDGHATKKAPVKAAVEAEGEIIGRRSPKNKNQFTFELAVSSVKNAKGPFVALWDMNYDGKTFNETASSEIDKPVEYTYLAPGRQIVAARLRNAAGQLSEPLLYTVVTDQDAALTVEFKRPFYAAPHISPVTIASVVSPKEFADFGYWLQYDFSYDEKAGFKKEFSAKNTAQLKWFPPAEGRYLIGVRAVGWDDVAGPVSVFDVAIGQAAAQKQFENQGPCLQGSPCLLRAHSADINAYLSGLKFEWDFAYDGKSFMMKDKSREKPYIAHSFEHSGSFRVAYRLVDEKKNAVKQVDSMQIKVNKAPPVARINSVFNASEAVLTAFCKSVSASDSAFVIEWDTAYDGRTFKANKSLSNKKEIVAPKTKGAAKKAAMRCSDAPGVWSETAVIEIPAGN